MQLMVAPRETQLLSQPLQLLVMDNLSRHQQASVRERIEAADATLRFLPPCSSDFNSLEKTFSHLKAMLRKISERTATGLWDLNCQLVEIFHPDECANHFSSCGYDPECSKNALKQFAS